MLIIILSTLVTKSGYQKGEDYYGICDRHAVIPVKYCEQYFGISNFLSDKNAHIEMTTKEITPESVF